MNFDLLDNKTLIEIEIEDPSFIHFADIRLLNCNNLTHNEKVALAKGYWSGTKNRDINTEILFTGKFKISRILEIDI